MKHSPPHSSATLQHSESLVLRDPADRSRVAEGTHVYAHAHHLCAVTRATCCRASCCLASLAGQTVRVCPVRLLPCSNSEPRSVKGRIND